MRMTFKGVGFPLPFLVVSSIHCCLFLTGAAAQNLVQTEGICYLRNSSLKWMPPKVPTCQALADPHKRQGVPHLSPATTVDLKLTFHSGPVSVCPRGTGPPENSAQSWHPAYLWIQMGEPLIPALRGQDPARGRATHLWGQKHMRGPRSQCTHKAGVSVHAGYLTHPFLPLLFCTVHPFPFCFSVAHSTLILTSSGPSSHQGSLFLLFHVKLTGIEDFRGFDFTFDSRT